MHHLSIDLETYSSVPIAKAGAQKYISSPDFEILLFAYSVDGAPVEIIDLARGERLPPWLVQAITSPEYIKHAYNAPFEWGCLSKFLGTLPPDQWRCTMFHGLYCGYTAGLDATGKALGLAEDKRKLNTGKALIRYFCVPCAPTKANGGRTRNLPQHDTDKWELFKEYCRQDVVTEMEIERRLSAFPVPDFVQKQWETDLIINARGVAVDMDLVSGALYLGNVTRQNLTQEAMKISKLDNPNSVAQLTQWLQEAMGEELADLRKDTVARLLGKEDNSPQVQRMLEIRQELGKTSTKKYDAIEAAVCPDGRVRGLLQFYGANRTGRWAGRLVQVQNLPRTYTEPLPLARELVEHRKLDALRLIYGSVPDTLSQLIRTALWPRRAMSSLTLTFRPLRPVSSPGWPVSNGGWRCSAPTEKSMRPLPLRCSVCPLSSSKRAIQSMRSGKRARWQSWPWATRAAPAHSSTWEPWTWASRRRTCRTS